MVVSPIRTVVYSWLHKISHFRISDTIDWCYYNSIFIFALPWNFSGCCNLYDNLFSILKFFSVLLNILENSIRCFWIVKFSKPHVTFVTDLSLTNGFTRTIYIKKKERGMGTGNVLWWLESQWYLIYDPKTHLI